MLETYGRKMGDIKYDALDREQTIDILNANVRRPFMKNICLIAEPGMGKTHIVEYWAKLNKDNYATYEVDIEAMGGEGEHVFAKRIKELVAEVEKLMNNKILLSFYLLMSFMCLHLVVMLQH